MFTKAVSHAARSLGAALRGVGPSSQQAGAKAANGAGAPRSIVSITSLDRIPGTVLDQPLSFEGARGLEKLDAVQGEQLFASRHAFHEGLGRLNALLASQPDAPARSRLSPQEILGTALGIAQAARKTGADVEHPAMASLMYGLLCELPMDRGLRRAFEQHAQAIAHKLPLATLVPSRPGAWWQGPPAQRARALQDAFAGMPVLASPTRLATGTESRLLLDFGDFGALGARLEPRPQRDAAVLQLSQELLRPECPPEGELALALVPSLLAHEMFHHEQYSAMEVLHGSRRHSMEDWQVAVRYALSVGTQESLWSQAGGTGLANHLPHEQEAWALASLVVRATIRQPGLSDETRALLTQRLVDTFHCYAHLLGERFAPSPASADGCLWDGDGHLQARYHEMGEAEIRQRVEAFIHEPALAPPSRPEAPGPIDPASRA